MKSSNSNTKLKIVGLILCAGSGSRTGLSYNKIFHYVGKKTLLETTIDRFSNTECTELVLVINPHEEKDILELIKNYKNITLCEGGDTRMASVRKGLNFINSADIVVIHDGARPNVLPSTINESIGSALEFGSGVVAVPTVDTIKQIKNNVVIKTLARSGLYNIQTPQAFRFAEIVSAYNTVKDECTDDSEVYEKFGLEAHIVTGAYSNNKITTVNDLYQNYSSNVRIGVGFDVHKLTSGRKLIIGGVEIPHKKGLNGHSDADVLLHAIMDALLSASGFPDIGHLFPDTNPYYEGISSVLLLEHVFQKLVLNNFRIVNVSAVVIAEKPKLAPYIPQMQQVIAKTLKLNLQQINISATTTETLGVVGNEKGIASSATCLISQG